MLEQAFPVSAPAAPPDAPRGRPVRAFPPPPREEAVVVAPPPTRLEPEASRWLTTVLPALSSLGIVGFAIVSGSLLYLALGIGLAVLGVGAAVAARAGTTRSRHRRQARLRERYAEHLDECHTTLVDLATAQRQALERVHPDPGRWADVLGAAHLWERRPTDPDFTTARLGRGRLALTTPLRLEPATPSADEEPDLREEAELLVALHSQVDDAPAVLDLRRRPSLVLQGPAVHSRPLLRAVVLGLALTHAPGELDLLCVTDDREREWLAQLPHTTHSVADLGALSSVLADLEAVCTAGTSFVQVLVVDAAMAADATSRSILARLVGGGDGPCLLLLAADAEVPPAGMAALAAADGDGGLQVRFADGSPGLRVARPDAVGFEEASMAARALARVRWHDDRPRSRSGPVRLGPLLADPGEHPELAVPIGADELGNPVELDFAEAACGGDGPHGLLVGATGSGKSELLRAIIAGLVTRRSPAELALVCWDFKGGAAVAPFAGLPHVRGTLTNLESDPRLLDRAARSLRAELRRRQLLLRAAEVDSRLQLPLGHARSAFPSLLLVVDEFSELLATSPDLLDLFVSIGRVGRSLGVHLLLASQRLDEGRLRGLESHLRYRICLRTFSAADSHTILGTDAAFRLPAAPGSGLLSIDGRVRRFDGAFTDDLPRLVDQAATRWKSVTRQDDALWHPALPEVIPLVETSLARGPDLRLTADIGLVDLPDEQSRAPLTIDLRAGHLAVVGRPRSGRTTLLKTLAAVLTARNRPERLQIYVIADQPGEFDGISRLPHVGAVCAADDDEQLSALLTRLAELVRSRRSPGSTSRDRSHEHGDVVLLVDGWQRVRERSDRIADLVGELAATGLRHGVHLVWASAGWSDFRAGVREHLGTKLELRLPDPYESDHGRKLAADLPAFPGRVLTAGGAEAQICLPYVAAPAEDPAQGQADLLETISARGGSPAPRIRTVPARVDLSTLRTPPGSLVLGSSAATEPESVDLGGVDRQLLVIGAGGSGRSTTLRTLLCQLSPDEVDLWVIDPRRSLVSAVVDRAAYAYSAAGAARLLQELAERCEARRPADGWNGNELSSAVRPHPEWRRQVLVIDDYDLVPAAGMTGPLGPLAELIPLAGDMGLSLVIGRRPGGRVGFDGGWQSLQDQRPTGLLLSGDPREGPVLGDLRLERRSPGRGVIVRDGLPPTLVQVAVGRVAESAAVGARLRSA